MASTVEQPRGLDADGDLVNANIECCRQVAIEARRVLLETGGTRTRRAFEEERARRGRWGAGRMRRTADVIGSLAAGVG